MWFALYSNLSALLEITFLTIHKVYFIRSILIANVMYRHNEDFEHLFGHKIECPRNDMWSEAERGKRVVWWPRSHKLDCEEKRCAYGCAFACRVVYTFPNVHPQTLGRRHTQTPHANATRTPHKHIIYAHPKRITHTYSTSTPHTHIGYAYGCTFVCRVVHIPQMNTLKH